ncbi:Rhomboid-related protein 3 [Plecturocebus cupreus]
MLLASQGPLASPRTPSGPVPFPFVSHSWNVLLLLSSPLPRPQKFLIFLALCSHFPLHGWGVLGNLPDTAWTSVGQGLGTEASVNGGGDQGTHISCDPGNTGYISTGKFRSLLESHSSKLDPHKREVLLALADSHADGQIGYQDFVNLMSNKRSNSFRQAILQGNRRLSSKALLEEKGLSLSQRLIRHVAYETLPREIDRKWYYDSYTCCPPPWFMITVAFFLYNGVSLGQFVLQVTHPRYLKNSLVYHPQLRAQAWRYLTYIFMHAGIEHLGLNVVLQLLVGVPLEMVHGATRIGLVYVAGVVAGSLAVSVADMTAPVVGSSGGVYALVSAHLANIVMPCSLPSLGLSINPLELAQPRPNKCQADLTWSRVLTHSSPPAGPFQMGAFRMQFLFSPVVAWPGTVSISLFYLFPIH